MLSTTCRRDKAHIGLRSVADLHLFAIFEQPIESIFFYPLAGHLTFKLCQGYQNDDHHSTKGIRSIKIKTDDQQINGVRVAEKDPLNVLTQSIDR